MWPKSRQVIARPYESARRRVTNGFVNGSHAAVCHSICARSFDHRFDELRSHFGRLMIQQRAKWRGHIDAKLSEVSGGSYFKRHWNALDGDVLEARLGKHATHHRFVGEPQRAEGIGRWRRQSRDLPDGLGADSGQRHLVGGGPYRRRQASTSAQALMDAAQSGWHVGHEHQAPAAQDRVEVLLGYRDRLAVNLAE